MQTEPQLRNPAYMYTVDQQTCGLLTPSPKERMKQEASLRKAYMTQSLLKPRGLPVCVPDGGGVFAYTGAPMAQLGFHLTRLWTSFGIHKGF